MLDLNAPYFNIKRIELVHEVVLGRCAYPYGRGFYGIIYCIEGEAEYKFSTKNSCTVGEGEIIILSPNASYSINTIRDFKHCTVNFEIHEDCSNINFLKDDFFLFHPENPRWYANLFKKLVNCWTSRKTCYESLSTAYLYELFAFAFSELMEREYKTNSYFRLNPAKEYIDTHFDSDISLDVLANIVNMSVTHFRREWINLYGETAFQYRDRLRLSFAEKYLTMGYYTVAEVAEKCGFSDANYFTRFFKKHTGMSPGRFIKRI